ncbi:unnamed protein product [Microthlaspi erraticum]|uniref:Uncharacterized protein n=1 Tax=Microthlaspi erraticum TaxID=1685480 RepID=A0A6D2HTA3_9BRAS|nr:unnamed protein product [Microthlaspi erraticum]
MVFATESPVAWIHRPSIDASIDGVCHRIPGCIGFVRFGRPDGDGTSSFGLLQFCSFQSGFSSLDAMLMLD